MRRAMNGWTGQSGPALFIVETNGAMGLVWTTLIYIIGFVLIHLYSKKMKFLNGVPRSRFLSLAGGISVAYVFLYLLPELAHFQSELEGELNGGVWAFIESHIYVVAMLGLGLFYGLEVMVVKAKKRDEKKARTEAGVFWIHIGSFILYNSLIGYLLVQEHSPGSWGTFFYFAAMGLHFIANDNALSNLHEKDYDRYGRWLLTAAVVIGWLVGIATELSDLIVSFLVALLAGGIILNVLKEELPEDRESSFSSFALGVLLYSVLILVI